MCLIAFAWRQSPAFPLILAANRDELYRRPTRAAHLWPDAPVIGGLDEEAGGSWLAAARSGRWGAVTNVRLGPVGRSAARSRGCLVRDFVVGGDPASSYAERIAEERGAYAPFNLLVGDGLRVSYVTSQAGDAQDLASGVYGVSNGRLDAPWPKVTKLVAALEDALDDRDPAPRLFEALSSTAQPDDDALPDTGVGPTIERALAPAFICTPDYGTRASTVLLIDSNRRARLIERRFGLGGELLGTSSLVV